MLFLTKNTLQILEVTIPNRRHDIVSIKVVGKHIKWEITLGYRPLKSKVADDIDLYNTLVDVVTTQHRIVLGDFNIPDIDWETNECTATGQRLIYFADDKFMTQMVEPPTRGSNIIDILFSSSDSHVTNVKVGKPLRTSDHNCIHFFIEVELKTLTNCEKVPSFRLAISDGLRESNITLGQDVNQSFNNFLTALKILS
ncbi:hypothetical protein EQH57_0786 [Dictyocoela roeselum]|nr:hypothetical protein EQH57_0786 [Dictyocoela roeselum]